MRQPRTAGSARRVPILVAAYSMSQWALLGRVAERFRAAGHEVGIVYFGSPGPAESAIRDAAAQMGCRYFDQESLSASAEPAPAAAVQGEVLAPEHPYRLLVRRQLAASRRILDESGAGLVIVGEDGIGGDSALIATARRWGIPVMVTPYGFGESRDYDVFLDDKHREGTLNRVPDDEVGRFVRERAPRWIRRRPYGEVLIFPAEFVAARVIEGLDQPLPWVVQGGSANVIAVESPAMRRHYIREGIAAAKLAEVGTIFCDAVLAAMGERAEWLEAFRARRKIRPGRTAILVSMPPSYHDFRAERCELATYEEFCRVVLGYCAGLPGAEVTVSMHPNSGPDAAAAVRATGARISERWVVELIGQHDVFLTVFSSTIRWAIAAGKPVANFDLYDFRLPTYEDVPGVATANRLGDLKRTLASLAEDEEYHRIAELQAGASGDWGRLDGRNFERLRALASSLVDPKASRQRA